MGRLWKKLQKIYKKYFLNQRPYKKNSKFYKKYFLPRPYPLTEKSYPYKANSNSPPSHLTEKSNRKNDMSQKKPSHPEGHEGFLTESNSRGSGVTPVDRPSKAGISTPKLCRAIIKRRPDHDAIVIRHGGFFPRPYDSPLSPFSRDGVASGSVIGLFAAKSEEHLSAKLAESSACQWHRRFGRAPAFGNVGENLPRTGDKFLVVHGSYGGGGDVFHGSNILL